MFTRFMLWIMGALSFVFMLTTAATLALRDSWLTAIVLALSAIVLLLWVVVAQVELNRYEQEAEHKARLLKRVARDLERQLARAELLKKAAENWLERETR